MTRLIEKVWRCAHVASGSDEYDEPRERRRHRIIAKVDDDISELRYNTAIASLMEFARDLDHEKADARPGDVKTLLQLLAPFAPYVTEELWERTGGEGSIHDSHWPEHDLELAAAQQVTIALQVNGKVRATVEVDAGTDQETLIKLALEHPRIAALVNGNEPRKVIAVVDKIVNVVP